MLINDFDVKTCLTRTFHPEHNIIWKQKKNQTNKKQSIKDTFDQMFIFDITGKNSIVQGYD